MTLLSDPVAHRLGWVLVHTLWEGAAVALLLALALFLLRKSAPATRYTVSCAALGLLAVLPAVNFALVPKFHRASDVAAPSLPATLPREARATALPTVTVGSDLSVAAGQAESASAPPSTSSVPLFRSVEKSFPWIVGAWAIGVALLSVWHLGGWLQVQRIRRTRTRPVGHRWDRAVARLSRTMAVTRTVRLFESALVQVPVVVGWLRPVILVPASAVSGLSPGQLEAILAHELAHVRRHDYVVNLLQAAVETVLFYHPAVWWVSSRIRAEREDCCDDLASRAVGDPVAYARALAAMEELRSAGSATPGPALALAADGGASQAALLNRIRRLVGAGSVETFRRPRAWSAAAALVVLALPLLPLLGDVVRDKPDTASDEAAIDGPTSVPSQPLGRDIEARLAPLQPIPAPVGAKREELTRQIDERIRVSRDLAESRSKLANLEQLSATGGDPPGLDEQLAADDTYNRLRQAIEETALDLATMQDFGDRHPRVQSARARMGQLRQKLEDKREEKRAVLFAASAAQLRGEVDVHEKRLKDLRDAIDVASGEIVRDDARRQENRAAQGERPAAAQRKLTEDDIARIDPAMAAKVGARDRTRAELDDLGRTMLPNHPTVRKLQGRLDAENKGIDAYAKQFRDKWVVSGNFVLAPPAAAPKPTPAEQTSDARMQTLLRRRDAVQIALEKQLATVTDNHPSVVGLRSELDAINRRIESAAAEADAIKADGAKAAAQADDVKGEVGGGHYFISGVPRPGVFALGKRPVNLLQALIAGGLDVDTGRGREVMLLRREAGDKPAERAREVVTTLTVGELVEQRDRDVFLRADDIIVLKAAQGDAGAGAAAPGGKPIVQALAEAPPGAWALVSEALKKAGDADAARAVVLSAFVDGAGGAAFVALRVPGGEGDRAFVVRLRRGDRNWAIDAVREGPLESAGVELDAFQKQHRAARRFAEPFSVPPLKPNATEPKN